MNEIKNSCEIMGDFKAESVPCENVNDNGSVKSMSFDDYIQAATDLYKSAPKDKNPYDEMAKAAARVGFEDQPELVETAERLGITPAKLKSMREYAINLRKQNPKIKMSTVRSKILLKYKINLV